MNFTIFYAYLWLGIYDYALLVGIWGMARFPSSALIFPIFTTTIFADDHLTTPYGKNVNIHFFAPIPSSFRPAIRPIHTQSNSKISSFNQNSSSPFSRFPLLQKEQFGYIFGEICRWFIGNKLFSRINNGKFAPIPTLLTLAIRRIGKLNKNQFDESQFFSHHFKKRNSVHMSRVNMQCR
jgi:hypothetical protein